MADRSIPHIPVSHKVAKVKITRAIITISESEGIFLKSFIYV